MDNASTAIRPAATNAASGCQRRSKISPTRITKGSTRIAAP
jgi:hypothetical protein